MTGSDGKEGSAKRALAGRSVVTGGRRDSEAPSERAGLPRPTPTEMAEAVAATEARERESEAAGEGAADLQPGGRDTAATGGASGQRPDGAPVAGEVVEAPQFRSAVDVRRWMAQSAGKVLSDLRRTMDDPRTPPDLSSRLRVWWIEMCAGRPVTPTAQDVTLDGEQRESADERNRRMVRTLLLAGLERMIPPGLAQLAAVVRREISEETPSEGAAHEVRS